jgi:hypothetical protein
MKKTQSKTVVKQVGASVVSYADVNKLFKETWTARQSDAQNKYDGTFLKIMDFVLQHDGEFLDFNTIQFFNKRYNIPVPILSDLFTLYMGLLVKYSFANKVLTCYDDSDRWQIIKMYSPPRQEV